MSLERHKVQKENDRSETPHEAATQEHDPLQEYRLQPELKAHILAHQKDFLFLNDVWARSADEAPGTNMAKQSSEQAKTQNPAAPSLETAKDLPYFAITPAGFSGNQPGDTNSPANDLKAGESTDAKSIKPSTAPPTNEPLKEAAISTDQLPAHHERSVSHKENQPESLMHREHGHHRAERTHEVRRHHHGRVGGRNGGGGRLRNRRHRGHEIRRRHQNNDDEVMEGAETEEPPEKKVDSKVGDKTGAQPESKNDAKPGNNSDQSTEHKTDGKVDVPPDAKSNGRTTPTEDGKPGELKPPEKFGKNDAKSAGDDGKLVELMKDLGRGIAGIADKVAGLIDTSGDCARGPRLTFKSLGFILPPMIATEQGKALEQSGLFKEVPRSEAREGDYAYRHWNPRVIRAHHGVDKGDSFFVTGVTKTGQLRGANDHHFLVPEDGGRYCRTKILRPTEEFWRLYGDKLKRHSS